MAVGWLVALLAAVPNVLVIAPYLPGLVAGARQQSSPARMRRCQSRLPLNLLYSQEDRHGLALAYLEQQSADLLVLSEFTPRWREKSP